MWEDANFWEKNMSGISPKRIHKILQIQNSWVEYQLKVSAKFFKFETH